MDLKLGLTLREGEVVVGAEPGLEGGAGVEEVLEVLDPLIYSLAWILAHERDRSFGWMGWCFLDRVLNVK
jgi:hypothetical protein